MSKNGPSPQVLKHINKIRKALPAFSREEIATKTGLTITQVDIASREWKTHEKVIGDTIHFGRPGPLAPNAPPKFVLAQAGKKFDAASAYAANAGQRSRLRTAATTTKHLSMLCVIGEQQAGSAVEKGHWQALRGTIHGAAIHLEALVNIEKAAAKKKKA